MRELQAISGGALLICDGIIRQAGPSRRIENLLQAKGAQEIDVKGQIVMPSFVSPDQALVMPESSDTRLAGLSAQRLQRLAVAASAGHARVGSLVVGAHTGWAGDLGTSSRVLRVHQSAQGKPLRIRSILSPPASTPPDELIQKWLPAIAKRKLAPIVDINLTAECSAAQRRREVAAVASTLGFALRLRTAGAPDPLCYELASDLGALALLSPYPAAAEWLTRMPGCVHVIQAIGEFDSDAASPQAFRKSLDNGWPAAISGGAAPGHAVANPQYLLHMAATRFGMAAEEAIMATTWNASCSLRMSHVTGSLEPGKAADLLIMDVPDYRELARRPGESDVYMSLSAGRVVYRRGGLILD